MTDPMSAPEVDLESTMLDALHAALHRPGSITMLDLARSLAEVVAPVLAARLAAQAAEHEREVARLRGSKDRWRTRAKEAQNELGDLRAAIGLSDTWTVDDSIGAYRHRADAAERALADLRGRVASILPVECWLTRHEVMRCTDMIGGGFEGGAKFTEAMCCLPCRVRVLLASEPQP